ncbi:MAG: hypothetical protein ACLPV8_01755 [Steroidobacteraceae bacterium]
MNAAFRHAALNIRAELAVLLDDGMSDWRQHAVGRQATVKVNCK